MSNGIVSSENINLIQSKLSRLSKVEFQCIQFEKCQEKGEVNSIRSKLTEEIASLLRNLSREIHNGENKNEIDSLIEKTNKEIEDAIDSIKINLTLKDYIFSFLTFSIYAIYIHAKNYNDICFVRDNFKKINDGFSLSTKDINLMADHNVEFLVKNLNITRESAREAVYHHYSSIFESTINGFQKEDELSINGFMPSNYFNEAAKKSIELWYITDFTDDKASFYRENYVKIKINAVLKKIDEVENPGILVNFFWKKKSLSVSQKIFDAQRSGMNILREVYLSKNEYSNGEKLIIENECQNLKKNFSNSENHTLCNLIFEGFRDIFSEKNPLIVGNNPIRQFKDILMTNRVICNLSESEIIEHFQLWKKSSVSLEDYIIEISNVKIDQSISSYDKTGEIDDVIYQLINNPNIVNDKQLNDFNIARNKNGNLVELRKINAIRMDFLDSWLCPLFSESDYSELYKILEFEEEYKYRNKWAIDGENTIIDNILNMAMRSNPVVRPNLQKTFQAIAFLAINQDKLNEKQKILLRAIIVNNDDISNINMDEFNEREKELEYLKKLFENDWLYQKIDFRGEYVLYFNRKKCNLSADMYFDERKNNIISIYIQKIIYEYKSNDNFSNVSKEAKFIVSFFDSNYIYFSDEQKSMFDVVRKIRDEKFGGCGTSEEPSLKEGQLDAALKNSDDEYDNEIYEFIKIQKNDESSLENDQNNSSLNSRSTSPESSESEFDFESQNFELSVDKNDELKELELKNLSSKIEGNWFLSIFHYDEIIEIYNQLGNLSKSAIEYYANTYINSILSRPSNFNKQILNHLFDNVDHLDDDQKKKLNRLKNLKSTTDIIENDLDASSRSDSSVSLNIEDKNKELIQAPNKFFYDPLDVLQDVQLKEMEKIVLNEGWILRDIGNDKIRNLAFLAKESNLNALDFFKAYHSKLVDEVLNKINTGSLGDKEEFKNYFNAIELNLIKLTSEQMDKFVKIKASQDKINVEKLNERYKSVFAYIDKKKPVFKSLNQNGFSSKFDMEIYIEIDDKIQKHWLLNIIPPIDRLDGIVSWLLVSENIKIEKFLNDNWMKKVLLDIFVDTDSNLSQSLINCVSDNLNRLDEQQINILKFKIEEINVDKKNNGLNKLYDALTKLSEESSENILRNFPRVADNSSDVKNDLNLSRKDFSEFIKINWLLRGMSDSEIDEAFKMFKNSSGYLTIKFFVSTFLMNLVINKVLKDPINPDNKKYLFIINNNKTNLTPSQRRMLMAANKNIKEYNELKDENMAFPNTSMVANLLRNSPSRLSHH